MISDQNFLAEYFALLHPHATPDEFKKTFGYRLLFEFRIPVWLRPIAYRIPPDVPLPNLVVRLLAFAPEQTVAEAYWHLGEAELAAGESPDGAAKLELAIAELAPANRTAQRAIAGNACYQYGAHAEAVRFYRAVLAEREDPVVMRSLAWVLATSRVDAVRNGREALALIGRAAPPGAPDYGYDSNAAAALAENGRFAEAVPIAERALAGARTAGDKAAAELNTQRLAAYRAGKPWRQ
jgi:tetratricopeptide (TPR) repeat protein